MKSIIALAGTLALVMLAFSALSASASYYLPSSISGYWVITQAATQSSGQAPTIVACGTFTISNIYQLQSGMYEGTLSFTLNYPSSSSGISITIPGVNAPAEQIALKASNPVPGVLFVAFKGSSPVPLFGSFTSPSSVPHPSIDPSKVGCQSFSAPEFLGLVHLPSQGTEGMTIYGETISEL